MRTVRIGRCNKNPIAPGGFFRLGQNSNHRQMEYATVCSGIEAPSVAWEPLGWKPVFFSEIETFPSKVLATHYPDVPNLGDMNLIDGTKYNGTIKLLCGGTPCQSFSVAGLRKGMDDPRGNLALVFLRIVDQARPKWVVWENVPGVLSSNGGRDFGAILGGLAELGYGWAYRVLDAQYFGVPQRRRRVFLVGCLGNWQAASAVLFEQASLRGDIAPRKKSGQENAGITKEGVRTYRYQNLNAGLVEDLVSETLKASCNSTDERSVSNYVVDFRNQTIGGISQTLTANGHGPSANNTPCVMAINENQRCELRISKVMGTLNTGGCKPGQGLPCVFVQSFHGSQDPDVSGTVAHHIGRNRCLEACISQQRFVRNGRGEPAQIASALTAHAGENGKGDSQQCVAMSTSGAGFWREGFGALRGREQDSHENFVSSTVVRRITPIEAERLQGFPDNYTNIPGAKDGPRYKALGNSMAVPVLKWIGERIDLIDKILNKQ
jgi:DNA (cytosine-5)-methyltransferase 1